MICLDMLQTETTAGLARCGRDIRLAVHEGDRRIEQRVNESVRNFAISGFHQTGDGALGIAAQAVKDGSERSFFGGIAQLAQGQRETDVMLARCGDFSDRITRDGDESRARVQWTFTRSKRGNAGAMWLHDEVAPRIRGLIRNAPAERRLLQDEETGADYHEDLFIRRWVKVRDLAAKALPALAGLQFRDLRRTFGILSRAGGATRDDAADVLGNSAATNPRLAETYMPSQLDTASRAVDAVKRPARKRG